MSATATLPASRLVQLALGVAALLVLTSGPPTALACSPIEGMDYKPVGMDVKVAGSPVVLSGIPTQRYDDPEMSTQYSVDFQVHCVFKGDNIGQVVRIDKVGYIPGLCEGTNLTESVKYMVYLEPAGSGNQARFTQKFSQSSGEKEYQDEAAYMCGAVSRYPEGVDAATAKFKCPPPNDYPDECLAPATTVGPPPTPAAPPTPGTPPEAPAPQNPANSGASYKSVVEKEEDEGDKDAAANLSGTWTVVVVSLAFLITQRFSYTWV